MSISRVQGNHGATNSGTSETATLTAGVTQGNLLVITLGSGNITANLFSPPDSSWHKAVGNVPNSPANTQTSIWYMVVDSAHAGQTSWTWTLSVSSRMFWEITEWSATHGWAASPLDVTASGDTASTPTQATTVSSGTTATTAQAEELWIAALSYKGSAQSESSITSGWTKDQEDQVSTGNTQTELYQIASATGTASVSYVIGTVAYWSGCVATFKDVVVTTPALSTSPTSLSFSATVGGSSPASQNDTLSETAGVATAWTSTITYGSGSGWLAISPTSGNLAALGNATISVTATLGSLAVGTYTGTVTFTATTGGATATISVTFTVSAPTAPQGQVSPTSLTFTAQATRGNPAPQNVQYSNVGNGSGSWSTSTTYGAGATGWLTTSPTSGTLNAGISVLITFTCTTGALAVGTYTATVTLTIGSSPVTVSVTFIVNPAPVTTFQIKLAGQDITQYVDQMSLAIDDTLGQGPGAGSSGSTQGRAATIRFNTSLGPMNKAIGAGQPIPSGGVPVLVRQGEIIVTDVSGTRIYGGYATKYTDTTTSVLGQTKQNFTTVEGIDYSTSLQRTLVNEVFSAQTDIQIIKFVMKKYAPWISLQYMPANPAYTFPVKTFLNVTVEQVLQTVAGITGYLIFVDYLLNLHYVAPTVASSAPFNLSDNPDFLATFPHSVTEFVVDDNSAINRVFFFGGTKLSNNFTQDVSPLANGNNTVFTLAYSPSPTTDGTYHVTINGNQQVVGIANSTGTANTFISQGGLAQVLIDSGNRSMTFDVAPATGSQVLVQYRFSFPLSLVITDEASHKFFGPVYLDGSINDNTIFDLPTGVQRCKVLLAQQNYGLVTLKVDAYKAGVQAGMLINVHNTLRGINGTYLVQEVQIEPLGGGSFTYHLTLGAWNWGLIDYLLKLPTLATFQDDQQTVQETVEIKQLFVNAQVHDAWATRTSTSPYYARATPVGDGHDAYPGFSTISS